MQRVFTQAPNAQSPRNTPEASLPSQPSADRNVPQGDGAVNTMTLPALAEDSETIPNPVMELPALDTEERRTKPVHNSY